MYLIVIAKKAYSRLPRIGASPSDGFYCLIQDISFLEDLTPLKGGYSQWILSPADKSIILGKGLILNKEIIRVKTKWPDTELRTTSEVDINIILNFWRSLLFIPFSHWLPVYFYYYTSVQAMTLNCIWWWGSSSGRYARMRLLQIIISPGYDIEQHLMVKLQFWSSLKGTVIPSWPLFRFVVTQEASFVQRLSQFFYARLLHSPVISLTVSSVSILAILLRLHNSPLI